MNDDEILEYNSEDLHNPVYAKPRTRPIISSQELVGRDNASSYKGMKNLGIIGYDLMRVLPGTRYVTDVIDFGKGLADGELDQGVPGSVMGAAGEAIGDAVVQPAKPIKSTGNKLLDQYNLQKRRTPAGRRRFKTAQDAAELTELNKKLGAGIKLGGTAFKIADTFNDSAKLGDHLYQWWRYGDIDEERDRLKEDIESKTREKAAKAAEVLKGINWRK
jgi:hypothetical protein